MIKKTAKIGGIIVSAPFINIGQYQLFASTTQKYSKQTVDLVTESLVIDMLGLLSLNGDTRKRWGPDGTGITDADIKEFKSSGINVFHNAYGVGGRNQTEAKINVLNFVGSMNSMIANRSDFLMRIDSIKDMREVMKNGKLIFSKIKEERFPELDEIKQLLDNTCLLYTSPSPRDRG